MRRHLLVTNDFPPKVGGIQSYLYELWRRLPSDRFAVFTTPYGGADVFDAAQPFEVVRARDPWLLPRPGMAATINALARRIDAELVVLDPALPIGAIGPALDVPYAVILHGAEVTVPGRLPGSRQALARVLRDAELVIAAGGYPAAEAERAADQSLPTVIVPPGVDTERFRPLDAADREAVRAELGLGDRPILHTGSRLVRRKGIDIVMRAAELVQTQVPDLAVVVTGSGRDRRRLERVAGSLTADIRFMGRVTDDLLVGIYGAADVFSMLCQVRWAGLEQEGFGIVFLEAGAAGTPQVAGASGGAHEAVDHGVTGLVVDQPTDIGAAAAALTSLFVDSERRDEMARAARAYAEAHSYDRLAARLVDAL